MLETFLITGRETLEAALVIGVTIAYLSRTGKHEYKKTVFAGVLSGILASILGAYFFISLTSGFTGRTEELFEGIMMLVGAILLTTMIVWMFIQKGKAASLEKNIEKQLAKQSFSHVGLFAIIFVAILREGIETVIFLSAIQYSTGINILAGIAGIAVAAVVGYLFFTGSKKMPLRTLFTTSSILLILFAAGLVGHGVHELAEANVLPAIIDPVYDVSAVLSESSPFGSLLKGLFGYNANPTLIELLAYVGYVIGITLIYFRVVRNPRHTIPQ